MTLFMKALRICLTGRPGIGKTTVVMKVISDLRKKGLKIGGIFCPEERKEGKRVGFKIIDLLTGIEGWLAKVQGSQYCPPQLTHGKYCIVLDDVIAIGVKALKTAFHETDIIVIDEIGPMELKVPELRKEIINVLQGFNKPIIAVVHYRLRDQAIKRLLGACKYYEVTYINRNYLPLEILKLVLNTLKG